MTENREKGRKGSGKKGDFFHRYLNEIDFSRDVALCISTNKIGPPSIPLGCC